LKLEPYEDGSGNFKIMAHKDLDSELDVTRLIAPGYGLTFKELRTENEARGLHAAESFLRS
jgi:hypothetical protein